MAEDTSSSKEDIVFETSIDDKVSTAFSKMEKSVDSFHKAAKKDLDDLDKRAKKLAASVGEIAPTPTPTQIPGIAGGDGGGAKPPDKFGALSEELFGGTKADLSGLITGMENLATASEEADIALSTLGGDASIVSKIFAALGVEGVAATAGALVALTPIAAGAVMMLQNLLAATNAYKEGAIALNREVDKQTTIMQALGEQQGYTQQQLNKTVEVLRDQGVTTREATESVNSMLQNQTDLAYTTKLATVAQEAANRVGLDSSETYRRISTAVNSANAEGLSYIGIVTSSELAVQHYRQEMGMTSREILTFREQQEAMAQEIIRVGKSMEGAYDGAEKSVGSMQQAVAHVHEEIQLALGAIKTPVADVFTRESIGRAEEFGDIMTDLQPDLKELGELLADLAESFVDIIPPVRDTVSALEQLFKIILLFTPATLIHPFKALDMAFRKDVNAVEMLTTAFSPLIEGGKQVVNVIHLIGIGARTLGVSLGAAGKNAAIMWAAITRKMAPMEALAAFAAVTKGAGDMFAELRQEALSLNLADEMEEEAEGMRKALSKPFSETEMADKIKGLFDTLLDMAHNLTRTLINLDIERERRRIQIALRESRRLEDLAIRHNQRMADIAIQTSDHVEDVERQTFRTRRNNARQDARYLEDIALQHARYMQDIARQEGRYIEDVALRHRRALEDIYRAQHYTRIDMDTETARTTLKMERDRNYALIDLEKDFQRQLYDIKVNFMISAREAAMENDAIAYLRAKRTMGDNVEMAKIQRERQTEDVGIDYARQQEEFRISLDQREYDLQISLQRQLEALRINEERAAQDHRTQITRRDADYALSLARQEQDHQTSLNRREQDFITSLSDQQEDWIIAMDRRQRDYEIQLGRENDAHKIQLTREEEDYQTSLNNRLEDLKNNFQDQLDWLELKYPDMIDLNADALFDMSEDFKTYFDENGEVAVVMDDFFMDWKTNLTEIKRLQYETEQNQMHGGPGGGPYLPQISKVGQMGLVGQTLSFPGSTALSKSPAISGAGPGNVNISMDMRGVEPYLQMVAIRAATEVLQNVYAAR